MLKNILELEGAQKLTSNEQKNINGGVIYACKVDSDCIKARPIGYTYVCINGGCYRDYSDMM